LKQITALVFESLPDVTRRAAAGGIADQFTVEHVKLLGRLSDAFKQQGPVLASAVIDKDPAVRLSTLYALEEVANAVRKYQLTTEKAPLPDKSPPPGPAAEPRALAVHIALRETIPAVRKELFDPDVRVRRSAVNVLEFMGPDAQDAVYDLVAATRDKDLFVRWSAVRALGALISRPSTKPLLSESELDRVVHGGMSRLLEEPDVNLRLAVLTALGRLGPRARAAVPVLWETVNRSDSDYRVNVLRTLQSIGPAAVEGPAGAVVTASGVSLPAFAKVLADPDTEVRKTAAETFGRFADALKPEEKGTKLYRLLNDPSSDVRSALIRLLDDPDTDVRRAASEALLQVPR
jgi:HEAT repeat protein